MQATEKPSVQQQLNDALLYLSSVCDGAKTLDDQGFNGGDARNSFVLDMVYMARTGQKMSYRQMYKVWQTLKKYEDTQLSPAGLALPEPEQIKVFAQESGAKISVDANILHCDDDFLYVHTAFRQKGNQDKMQSLKTDYYNLAYKEGAKYRGHWHYKTQESKATWLREMVIEGAEEIKGYWRFPRTIDTIKLILSYFPALQLTAPAQDYHNKIVEVELALKMEKLIEDQARKERCEKLLRGIGGIDFKFGGGKQLFDHQKIGVTVALSGNHRWVNTDETGLGKTLQGLTPALALQKAHGWPIYVITTVSSQQDWLDIAEALGAKIEVFSWAHNKIPVASNDHPANPFILVTDEIHYMASFSSRRTRALLALAWHWNCKAFFGLTGTPLTNGRPRDAYPILLAARNEMVYPQWWQVEEYPIVWESKAYKGVGTKLPGALWELKREYEEHFCAAEWKEVKKGLTVWDNSGTSNMHEFYLRTQYRPGKENFSSVCCISRRKVDTVNLPPKMRTMYKAEISAEAKKQFAEMVVAKWKEFEAHILEQIEKMKKEIKEKEGRNATPAEIAQKRSDCMNARALVEYGIFRQAGSWAKMDTALELSLEILGRGNKLVVFTAYADIAKELGRRITEATGKKVQYILGSVKKADRVLAMRDFQDPDGETQVIISTAAGGEAITLTASQFMIIIDRPLTPGRVKQWEDRCHRLTTTGTVTIYWLQLPASLCEIDFTVDGVLDKKQRDIDSGQFGLETGGLEFVSEKQLGRVALDIMVITAKKLSKKYGKAA